MGRVKFWVILLVHYFGRFVSWITEPLFRWKYDSANRGLPPVNSPLLMMTAVELASQIRKRKVVIYNGIYDRPWLRVLTYPH